MLTAPSCLARPVRRFGGGFLLALTIAATGCGYIKGKAVRMVGETLASGGDTFTRDDDPELVGGALPMALKLYETILEDEPKEKHLLVATCAAFTQYGYGWVEFDAEKADITNHDEGKRLQGRAFRLFQRGKGYCFRALELRFPGIGQKLIQDPVPALAKAKKGDVEMLYWSAASWGLAIGLQTDLAIDLPSVRALAERGLALDETWHKGALHELMITLESGGPSVGGSEERARKHFARAVELQEGKSPSPYIALAMGICVAKQDRAEFEALMHKALAVDPEKDKSNRLVIMMAQARAQWQLDHIDALFSK
jgi:hypothetical protein